MFPVPPVHKTPKTSELLNKSHWKKLLRSDAFQNICSPVACAASRIGTHGQFGTLNNCARLPRSPGPLQLCVCVRLRGGWVDVTA